MNKSNFGYEKYIDINFITDIITKNTAKKIYVFGAGTAAEILTKSVLKDYKIEKFLDNNEKLHGDKIYETEICSPNILKDLSKGEYIVLILSAHSKAIGKQLMEMGLQEETDFYNIYTPFLPYFKIKKFENTMNKFVQFLERIPEGFFDAIPLKGEKKVGLVCLCEMNNNIMSFSLAKALLLRYYGYRATLIIDPLRGFDSLRYFEGIEDVTWYYVEKVLKKLKEKCKDIEITIVNGEGEAELDEQDVAQIEREYFAILKWHDSRVEDPLLKGVKNREEITKVVLGDALKFIKAYFAKHQFDSIDVFTGSHKHRCLYMYIARRYGMRASTYDIGGEIESIQYSADGEVAHAEEIARLVKGQYFSETQKREILRLSRENFLQRKNATVKNAGYNYQIAEYSEEIVPYDVIIPLNISWDAAALKRDRIFATYTEWLEKTLHYIMENTTASVLVREHPAQNVFSQFAFDDLEEKLPILNEYKDRIKLVKAKDKINTYQYLEACNLVLPYTSTIGLEAVMLEKNIIIHSKVYYEFLDVGYRAVDEKDYFNAISYYLEHPEEKAYTNVENAFFAYYCQMNRVMPSKYNIIGTEWLDMSLQDLATAPNVNKIVDAVVEGNSTVYWTLIEKMTEEA